MEAQRRDIPMDTVFIPEKEVTNNDVDVEEIDGFVLSSPRASLSLAVLWCWWETGASVLAVPTTW